MLNDSTDHRAFRSKEVGKMSVESTCDVCGKNRYVLEVEHYKLGKDTLAICSSCKEQVLQFIEFSRHRIRLERLADILTLGEKI